jgi:hypothetical protein
MMNQPIYRIFFILTFCTLTHYQFELYKNFSIKLKLIEKIFRHIKSHIFSFELDRP